MKSAWCWVVLGFLGLGCGAHAAPAPIVVGHVANLTGVDRRAGEQASLGLRLALDDLNKDAAQRPIQVRHADTQGQLEAYEGQAIRLVTLNRVVGLLGGNTPEELVRMDRVRGPVATGEQTAFLLPIVSPCGWPLPALSEQVFLVGMNPADQGKVLGRFAVEELNLKRAVIFVNESQDSFRELADSFQQEFLNLHRQKNTQPGPMNPVVLGFDKPEKLAKLLPRLEEEKGAVVLMAGTKADLRQLCEQPKQPVPVVLYGGEDGSLRPGEISWEGSLYLASAFAMDKNQAALEDFAQRFRKQFQKEPEVQAALAYESMRLLGEALRRNSTLEAVRDELLKTKEFVGLAGPLTIGQRRQFQRTLFVLRLEGNHSVLVKKYPQKPPSHPD